MTIRASTYSKLVVLTGSSSIIRCTISSGNQYFTIGIAMAERLGDRCCEIGKLINENIYLYRLFTFESIAAYYPSIPCYQGASSILRRSESKDSVCIGSTKPSKTAIPAESYITHSICYRWCQGLL